MTGWGSAIAALAFLAVVVSFYCMVIAYRVTVVKGAVHELEARAEVAARYLERPLQTLDFARIRRFGEECQKHGYELSILSRSGGRLYDTREHPSDSSVDWLGVGASCGESRIQVLRPLKEVFAPFRRALFFFALSVLVGAFGMFVVFFALYRQRVRIREMAKVERFRSEFIADVSHEIKTPLTGILGAVEMLEDCEAKGTGEGRRAKVLVDMIKKESKRLQTLVQEILDLARLEREGEKLNRVDTDLVALAADVARRYGVENRTAHVLADDLVASIDPQLIERALSNLVENAQRHSGSTDITISLIPSVPGGPIRLVVEDHGVGIPSAHLSQIFERFHRVDPARAADSGGAGLGLSIVRRIARLHGGEVTCENVVPHGARFTLALPVGKTPQS